MKNDKGLYIKDSNRWRVPRKLKKQIPKDTHYCYTPTSGWITFKDGRQGYKIKLCPLYSCIKVKDMNPMPSYMDEELLSKYGEDEIGWCKLVKYEIDDQCKSCGLREGLHKFK